MTQKPWPNHRQATRGALLSIDASVCPRDCSSAESRNMGSIMFHPQHLTIGDEYWAEGFIDFPV